MGRNFVYLDNLTAVPNGIIKYRFRMNIAADTSFYLDSATFNHTQNCNPQPVLTASGLNSFGPVCAGSTSPTASFTINGTNLPASNVVVSALTGYSYSTNVSGPFTSSLSLTQGGGTYNQLVYIRFSPTVGGTYNGNITISCGSSSALLAVSGSGIVVVAAMVTGAATTITTQSAVLGGQLTNAGCGPVADYGIEYSTLNGFVNGTGIKLPSINIIGSSYSVIAGQLSPNTTYYYKAYGVNISGTGYGNQLSFKTLPIPNELTIYNSPVAQSAQVHFSKNGIVPGLYAVRILNIGGQLVYKKELNVTGNFIDDRISLPTYVSTGVYSLQLINKRLSYKEQKSFIIN